MNKRSTLTLITIIAITLMACNAVTSIFATATPTSTSTPTATLTPIPTDTPTPIPTDTATPKPSADEILTGLGFTANSSLESSCGTPCKGYSLMEIDSGGFVIMNAAIYNDGQLRIIYLMTAESAGTCLVKAMKVVSAIYGDAIAQWMENHFVVSTGTVNTGNEVVDGHWVAVGAGQVDSKTVKIMLIVSPDTSVPAGVNP